MRHAIEEEEGIPLEQVTNFQEVTLPSPSCFDQLVVVAVRFFICLVFKRIGILDLKGTLLKAGIQIKVDLTDCCLVFSSMPPALERSPPPVIMGSIVVLLLQLRRFS